MKQIKIGIIGLGTVGDGVIKMFENIQEIVREKTGGEIVIKTLVDRVIDKERDFDLAKLGAKLSDNVDDILDDPEINIFVELIGGYEPAHSMILKALNNGKHVVTANKAVLAKYWDEFNEACVRNNVLCYFEASVGAGIPAIQGINEGLAGNRFNLICGILNGTTNFILTKMLKDNMDYDEALILAQKLGFAESDPTYDVKGIDAAHKIAILASLAYGKTFTIDDVYAEGIDEIHLDDVIFAKKELGLIIKLLAIAKKNEWGVELRVHPVFIPEEHLLAAVDSEYSAVYVDADAAGNIMFYGKGAGKMPAASGVVSDVIYIAKNIINGTAGKNQFVANYDNSKNIQVVDINEIKSKYYLRFNVLDEVGVLAEITDILAKNNVSVATCLQKDVHKENIMPLIMTTHKAQEADIKKAINAINGLKSSKESSLFMRIENEI
ncbi:MAG: homoserine dehydrogenase [bacterium]|nr:homoserine dehydrogenase [bacterium]